ncbi:MAG: hypothetical protein SR1Q7_01245 [Quinella sp. 1Q7]|nr:hypothetical protein [Quinella sp. 1Q7]
MLIIIVLLRFKIPIGACMLASGIFIRALRSARTSQANQNPQNFFGTVALT